MLRKRRRAVVAAAFLAVMGTTQACAVDDRASPGTEPPSVASPPSAASPRPVSSPPSGDARACGNGDVSVTVTGQPDRADGFVRALVSVVNRSAFPCRVHGHVGLALVNAADEVVDVPRENVDQPGPSVAATVAPGASAFQGIRWTPCDKGADACGVGNTLRFSLQSGGDGPVATLVGFPAVAASGITMATLQIGTLQPSRQGVVAW